MTRKDYVEFAKMFKSINNLDQTVVDKTIEIFKKDNPRFDEEKFLIAVYGG